MNKILLLLKVDVMTYFLINEFRQGRKKSSKAMTILAISMFILLLALYNLVHAIQLVQLEQADLIPANIFATASVLVLILTFFQYDSFLFTSQDFERLTVLPLSYRQLLLSKISFLYFVNLFLTILFMLPAGIVWLVYSGNLVLLVSYILLMIFSPLIPMCLVALLANVLHSFSSRIRSSPFLSLALSLLVLFSVLVFTLLIGSMLQSHHPPQSELATLLLRQITRLYPLAYLFISKSQFFGNTILFVLVSIVLTVIVFWLQSKNYRKICLQSRQKRLQKGTGKRAQHSVLFSLCQKEFRRFFHSYHYMLHGGSGVIMLIGIGCFLLIVSPERIFSSFQIGLIKMYLPFLLASFFVLVSPSASALSLEGRTYWLIATLPISQKQLIRAKLSLSLTIYLVTTLIILPIVAFRFGLDLMQIFCLFLSLLSYGLFTAIQGLYCNMLHPRFDWEVEVWVLKQSKAILLSAMIGGVSLLLPFLLVMIRLPIHLIVLVVSTILLSLSYYLYRQMLKKVYLFAKV